MLRSVVRCRRVDPGTFVGRHHPHEVVENGIDEIGYKSAAMTLDVYADLFEDDLDAVAVAMNDAGVNRRSGLVPTPSPAARLLIGMVGAGRVGSNRPPDPAS